MNTIDDFKELLKKVEPALTSNLTLAHDEYMKGELSNGAYQYVLSRHHNLFVCINSESSELDDYLLASSQLTIDLQRCVKDKLLEESIFNEWIEFYKNNGFKGTHEFFDIPIK